MGLTALPKACSRKEAFHFRRANIESRVPANAGIYLFWSGRLCVYVGQAKNLQDRLMSHWRKSHSDEINLWIAALGSHLCISYERVEVNLGRAEQHLIDRYSPHLNKINARRL